MGTLDDGLPSFEDEVAHFTQKCAEHLARTVVARNLAVAGGDKALETVDPKLLQQALGEKDSSAARVHAILTQSLFLELKANFELYLWTQGRAWLRHDLIGSLARASQKGANFLKQSTLQSVFNDGSPDSLLPVQGLEALTAVLEDIAPGFKVRGVVKQDFAQISVAFQVRHVVEHRKGRVDERFISGVKQDWRGSSWGKRSKDVPKKDDRVHVTGDDFDSTYCAMQRAVSAVGQEMLVAWTKRPPKTRT